MAYANAGRELVIHRGPGGYGFNLARINDMNVFRVVDEGGPTWLAGGRPGDRILEVASQDVSDLTHGLLVQAIKAAGSPLKLQVAAVQQPAPAARPQQAASGAAVKPVSIMINKGPKGFGMNLSRMGDDHVFRVVDPGGPAALAGAHPGDVIVEVAGKSVRGLDHKQLVDIIRPLQAVQMLLIPSLGRSGQALPKTEEHVWNQVRQKAQSVVAGQALAAEERARLDEQNRRELEQVRALRLKESYEADMKRLDKHISDGLRARSEKKEAAYRARVAAQGVAKQGEVREIEKVLDSIEENALKELAERHAQQLPDEDKQKRLALKRRQLEEISLDEELHEVRRQEWERLEEEAAARRRREKQEEEEDKHRVLLTREADMEFLKAKQSRVDQMLADAAKKREDEQKAAREKRERDAAARKAHQEEMRKLSVQQAKERAEASLRRQQEEELSLRREEEARLAREWEEDQAKRLQKHHKETEEDEKKEEDRVKNKGALWGTQLKKTAAAEPSSSASHPMLGHMAKARDNRAGGAIPKIPGMADERM